MHSTATSLSVGKVSGRRSYSTAGWHVRAAQLDGHGIGGSVGRIESVAGPGAGKGEAAPVGARQHDLGVSRHIGEIRDTTEDIAPSGQIEAMVVTRNGARTGERQNHHLVGSRRQRSLPARCEFHDPKTGVGPVLPTVV